LTWPPFGSALEMSPQNPPQREDAIDAVVKGATAALSGVESQIARNPLPSVLMALGFGVAVGFFSRR
jgi:hypothetical protein